MSAKMNMDINETCYINLLHNDILANILYRLPEPASIAHSVLACKLWCHVISIHGILRRHRPPDLCGVLRQSFHSWLFTPTNHMASADLVEMTNNFPKDLAESISGGPWGIIDSHESLLLLVRYQWCDIDIFSSWPVLAIFNPVTSELQELPPMANRWHWDFLGAAILRDDTGNGRFPLPRGVSVALPNCISNFKVVCVVKFSMSVVGNDECVLQRLVHSAGVGDKWSVISSSRISHWSFEMLSHRVGDVLFDNRPVRRFLGLNEEEATWSPHLADNSVMMLNMRTGSTCLMVPPLVNGELLDNYTFVEYGKGCDKVWFVCIRDGLVLWLYSHLKPTERSWTTLLRGHRWSLEREVELRPRIKDLTNEASKLRAHNVQSRNGYVFFAMERYGYFAINLRSMDVQRLSGVPWNYMGQLYPFMRR